MWCAWLTGNAGPKKSPSGHHRTTLSGYIFATKACIDNQIKNLLSSNISSASPHNMVNFGLLAAEIVSLVWGIPANFSGFCVLASLLQRRHSTEASQTLHSVWPLPGLVDYIYNFGVCCSVTEFCQVQYSLCVFQVLRSPIRSVTACSRAVATCQTLRRWAQGATYILQGDHQVGHWPTPHSTLQLLEHPFFLLVCWCKKYSYACLSVCAQHAATQSVLSCLLCCWCYCYCVLVMNTEAPFAHITLHTTQFCQVTLE